MNHVLTKQQVTDFLRRRDFGKLFIELGWDKDNLPSDPLRLPLGDGRDFPINRVVEKRGFVVCVCDEGKPYPAKSDRQKLVNQLARHHYEHLLIICGEGKQCWSVAIRPQNRPVRTVEVEWYEHQDIQPLMEKLNGMIFQISEEGELRIHDVVDRVRSAFMEGAEKVTKKFYSAFQKELSAFAEFIEGIREQVSREWYAALMLNRLMFIYFIQKKEFLDGDTDYLENRLKATQTQFGADTFHDRFYRHFLRRLFAEGLGTPEAERDPELKNLLGKVPYLNGGLFDLHEVEKENDGIEIPDKAFEKLFKFFGKYRWHLDSRPDASGKEINPDVIGYIFEKYINALFEKHINARAAMGAYYTQEDITGYIARNTIIPFLLNRAKDKCKNAFDAENGIWRFLRDKPDNYIYGAVKHGCDIPDEEIPEHIRRGMDTTAPGLLDRRKHWNTQTEKRFALPTEIWRETMARRARYRELQATTANGEVHEIDDLITYNLDIERFASDSLRYYEGSDFIAAFYEAIAGRSSLSSRQRGTRGITVLDPACGSGAFLFAALNILEPLYERCIERMRAFVEEDDNLRQQGTRKGTKKHPLFRAVLEDIKRHQNEKYWIYKTIVLNNLYGVDLMKEAAEIAKLRLFLKLAAEAEYDPKKANLGLEPLPDIDFNIRAGNSLVGFVSMEQFEQAVAIDPWTGQRRIDLDQNLSQEIREKAIEVQKANERFRQAQDSGDDSYRKAKGELSERLDDLNGKMNRYLAEQYGKQTEKGCRRWVDSHQPFHWLTEFYGIMEEDGGFDVVIGNPPYVEYYENRFAYRVRNYVTKKCRNLYAFFMERNFDFVSKTGKIGMIVPISSVSTDRMKTLQEFYVRKAKGQWHSHYAVRPGKLFAEVDMNLTITLMSLESKENSTIYSTTYNRWSGKHNRQELFSGLIYSKLDPRFCVDRFPKIAVSVEADILKKIYQHEQKLNNFCSPQGESLYYHSGGRYWRKALLEKLSSHYIEVVVKRDCLPVAFCLLNSQFFYWYWIIHSNCMDVVFSEVHGLPVFDFDQTHPEQWKPLQDDLLCFYSSSGLVVERRGKIISTNETNFDMKRAKSIVDGIDAKLAQHYNFTEEELDYIINYDIKYRMG